MGTFPSLGNATALTGQADNGSNAVADQPSRGGGRSAESAPGSDRVLVLVPGPDTAMIREVLSRGRLNFTLCASVDELCAQLARDAGAALLAEEVLTPPVMQRLVDFVDAQPAWSEFPFVILFGQVGRSPEVALRMVDLFDPLGNVNILERPPSPVGLVGALRTALRARCRQYQIRDLLEQQKQAIRHRERFLSMLAHELRDPLGSIRHATEILERLGPQTNQAIEQRALIARQTARLARLIDNVLDVSQLLMGKLTLRWGPVDLRNLVCRALQALAPEMETRHVKVAFAEPSSPLVVEGDAERLGKALFDLLSNTLALAGAGGRIQLNLLQRDAEAVVQLHSMEKAFASRVIGQLVEPLVEEHQLLEPHPQAGMKISLTVVSKIIELHEGSISVSSGPNGGSALEVYLPLRSVAGAPTSETPRVGTRADGPRRVLIIEDNADARETMRLLLQMWGHQATVVGTGPQGIQQAQQERPDVVLVDIGLPGMDGYEVARRLRTSLGGNVLLLAMTGYGPPHDSRRAREAGFDMHLVKPVDPHVLDVLLRAPEAAAARARL